MLEHPETDLARHAEALLRSTSPTHLVHHCLRSYHWSGALARLDGVDFDHETLFLAAALHDLGLLAPYDRGNPFELDGALAIAAEAEAEGWDPDLAAAVMTAVRQHVAARVERHDGPEAYLLWHGTGVDVSGSRLSELDPGLVDDVLTAFPRLDFRVGFARLFADQAAAKPGSRAALLVEGGLLRRLADCPLDRPARRQSQRRTRAQ